MMILLSSPISPLALGTDRAIVGPGRSQPQWFRASIPSAPLSPALALPKSEVPRMSELSLAVLPLWAFAGSAVWLAVGGFLMQVMVQGAWGVIPAHLNELSPDNARGTFPGFVYS